jgi:hypothetical protein
MSRFTSTSGQRGQPCGHRSALRRSPNRSPTSQSCPTSTECYRCSRRSWDEPEVAEADLIVVTVDHAAGPQPVTILDRLLDLGDRVLLVRGNADRELVALDQGKESTVGEPYEIQSQKGRVGRDANHIDPIPGISRNLVTDTSVS